MANTFKRKTLANANTTLQAVYTVPASTTTVVIGCTLSNITSGNVTASAQFVTAAGDDTYIVKDIPIPTGSSVEIMAGNKIVMEATDIIKVSGSGSSTVDTTMSIMEITA